MATLLVIEDNDLNMNLARMLLGGAGYVLLEATEAEQGLARARARPT